jgi:hypothetical protein
MSPHSSNGPGSNGRATDATDAPGSAASRTKAGRDGGGAGVTAVAVIVALVVGMIGIFDVAAGAAPQIGQPAPDFTALDSQGRSVQLHAYLGKTVVLEWTNADCPYTRKHYASGNMQSVQALAQQNGVVWLTVISSAPGKQGYVNGPAADALTQSRKAVPAGAAGSVRSGRASVCGEDNPASIRHRQSRGAAVHGRNGQHRDLR